MNVIFNAQKLGEVVYNRRFEEDETLRSLSERIGVSSSTISRVEAENIPDITTLCAICSWLKISPNKFFTVTKE